MWVLGVDIGTTSMKLGVFRLDGDGLHPVSQFSQSYEIHVYHNGLFADIDQSKWKAAFAAGCRALADAIAQIDVISLSGTTPGLTAMDANGDALYPAILMLDQRSHKQARAIIDTVGLDHLLATTANMPVAGGCSLAGILWLRDNAPEVFRQTHKFGHSNTYFAHWLTGQYALDPSSASLTGLYNTVRNDCTWNTDLVRTFGLSTDRLPQLIPAHGSVGTVRPALARELGFAKEPQVLIGGNDAVLAAYSVGVREPGEVINVNGTCEISLVCLPKCLPSPHYNIRAHVVPDRWLTLHVMNAGGKALEWFKSVFCSEMTSEQFYDIFIPHALDAWLDRTDANSCRDAKSCVSGAPDPDSPARAASLPPQEKSDVPSGASGRDAKFCVSTTAGPSVTYVPYLMGSRYSLDPLKAELLGLTQTTTREEILAAIVRGLCQYQSNHLCDIERHLPLRSPIHLTGGAVSPALIRAKQKWFRLADYVYEEDSSVKGAALLARLIA